MLAWKEMCLNEALATRMVATLCGPPDVGPRAVRAALPPVHGGR